MEQTAAAPPVNFELTPSQYKHWKLTIDGAVATLAMDVREDAGLRPNDYKLKLNSYDLGVDIELADILQRLRFEHPEVHAVVLTSLKPRSDEPLLPPMRTLCIAAGRKEKLRPGDVLGALTGEAGIPGDKVGKIALFDYQTLVAVDRELAGKALKRLTEGRIKGRSLKVRQL